MSEEGKFAGRNAWLNRAEWIFLWAVTAAWSICQLLAWQVKFVDDMAVYMITMLNTATFTVPHERYLNALAQLLPVGAIQLNLPLWLVLQLQVLNYALLNLLVALVLGAGFRDKRLLGFYLFFSIVGLQEIFFWQTSEQALGFNFFFLALGWARSGVWKGRPLARACVEWGLLALSMVAHPLLMVSVAFYVAWKASEGGWRKLLPFAGLLGAYIVWKLLTASGYERDRAGALGLEHLNLPALVQVLKNLVWSHGWMMVAAGLSAGLLFVWGSGAQALVWCAWVGGYVVITLLNGSFYDAISYYRHSLLLPLCFVALYPIFEGFAERIRGRLKGVLLVLGVVALAATTAHLWEYYRRIDEHLQRFDRTVAEMCSAKEPKVAIDDRGANPQRPFGWAMGSESILRTGLKGRDATRSLIYISWMPKEWKNGLVYSQHDEIFFCPFSLELNQHYFHLPLSPYVIKPLEER